jgi:menaquinone-specific isochorismate synthase
VAFAGCGIVAESDAEAEFAETELKFSPIRGALA